jgi:hypothetical protein
MSVYLDEQLDQIYLTEDVTKAISAVKSKGPDIVKAFSNGNFSQAKKLLNMVPSAGVEKVADVAKKRNKHYTHAVRLAKGDKTPAQKAFCILYSSFQDMRDNIPPESAKKLDEPIEKLEKFIKKYSAQISAVAWTAAVLMWFLAFLVYSIPVIGPIVFAVSNAARVFFYFTMVLIIAKIILDERDRQKGK